MARDRAYLRYQRDRVVAKRIKQYKRLRPWWAEAWFAEPPLQGGRFEDEQSKFGCGRARCGMCQDPYRDRRTRVEREAMRFELDASV